MNRKLAAFLVLTVATVALAASNIDNVVRILKGGAIFGRGTASESTDVITSANAGTITFDFPADGGCQTSPKQPCPRCRVGDPCFVGLGVTATAAAANNAIYSCFVGSYDGGTADIAAYVAVRECPLITTVDPDDAGYNWRVLSNQ